MAGSAAADGLMPGKLSCAVAGAAAAPPLAPIPVAPPGVAECGALPKLGVAAWGPKPPVGRAVLLGLAVAACVEAGAAPAAGREAVCRLLAVRDPTPAPGRLPLASSVCPSGVRMWSGSKKSTTAASWLLPASGQRGTRVC